MSKKKHIVKEKLYIDDEASMKEESLNNIVDKVVISLARKGERFNKRRIATCLIESVQNVYNYADSGFEKFGIVEVTSSVFGKVIIETHNLLREENKLNLDEKLKMLLHKSKNERKEYYNEILFDGSDAGNTNNGLGLVTLVVNSDVVNYDFAPVSAGIYQFNLHLEFLR